MKKRKKIKQPAVVRRARALEAAEKKAGPYGKPARKAFK